ncbi:ABC transporter ATP-binding protein [Lacticaseibacillus rhamnosus]|uniref:ATP-binding cassette domain-containing protein n=1 Tax=Lacticaseibacillus rhamnosus TaxID=47715 RepID=UPI0021A64505|nr:ABC transporter ATP-binding protein [Lacticaseibacillus rhamnosus]MCT3163462.1 ABC transporter ATP-binding protein [Lacticaseibacillus rhamnosus]
MAMIEVKNLKIHYPIRSGFFNRVTDHVLAVDGINFDIEQGETYGLIGESGSGKSTTGKAIVGLEPVTSGSIIYKGEDITKRSVRKRLQYNKDVQMIFQDSLSSLNPRKRIGVARAMATNPKLIVADEPVSALDLSVQAQVLNFMKRIQEEYNISYLFISHDLGVVKHMCKKMAIMHRGRFVEIGTREDIYQHPQHIYTKRLLSAIPDVNPDDRAQNKEHRREVERIFKEEESKYYSKEGRVLDLQKISDTHYVALPDSTMKGVHD